MVMLHNEVDVYATVRDGTHPIPPDLTLHVDGSQRQWSVHRAIVGRCELFSLMLGSGMREAQLNTVMLNLPSHTEELLGHLLEYCYNLTLELDMSCPSLIDLWRLCDYVGCHDLKALIRDCLDGCFEMTPHAFVSHVNRALSRGDEPARAIMETVLNALPEEPEKMEKWLEADGVCAQVDETGSWSSPLLETILRAAQHVNSSSADKLLKLVSAEICERWCELPAATALSPRRFAMLVGHVPPGEVAETSLCEVILSYVDRRGIAFVAETAQRLLRLVDMRLLPRDYVAEMIAPRIVSAAAQALLLDACASLAPLRCPLSLCLMQAPVRLPCGHTFDREAITAILRAPYGNPTHHYGNGRSRCPMRCPMLFCPQSFEGDLSALLVDESPSLRAHLSRKLEKRKEVLAWALEDEIDEIDEIEPATPAASQAKWQRTLPPTKKGEIIVHVVDHVTMGQKFTVVVDTLQPLRESLFEPFAQSRSRCFSGAQYDSAARPSLFLRFNFKGSRLNELSTAADLKMESGDQVEVFVAQVGGKPIIRIYCCTPLINVRISLDLREWTDVILYPQPAYKAPRQSDTSALVLWHLARVDASEGRHSSHMLHLDADGTARLCTRRTKRSNSKHACTCVGRRSASYPT